MSTSQVVALSDSLRAQRKQLGLTQAELADLSGVSARFVFDVKNGKPSVSFDKLLLVISTLGLELVARPASCAPFLWRQPTSPHMAFAPGSSVGNYVFRVMRFSSLRMRNKITGTESPDAITARKATR